LGNPKTQQIAAKYIVEKSKDSILETVSLSANDGIGNICECEACRNLDSKDAFKDPLNPDLSDRFFRFYLKTLKLAQKQKPDSKIAVLSYNHTNSPPHEVKLNKDIVVFLTGKKSIDSWRKTGASLATYQYNLDNAYMTIRHFPNAFAKYLRKLHKSGGIGFYAQLEHSWAAGGPKAYILAHLLWNVNSDVDKLMNDYCEKAYGSAAAQPMVNYFEQWENIYKRECLVHEPDDFVWNWNTNQLEKLKYLDWDDLKILDQCLQKATQAKKTPKQAKRLAYVEIYYRWIRSNIEQYLLAKDLWTTKWLEKHSEQQIINTANKALKLTKTFNQLWSRKIASDRSGWLLNQKPRVIKAIKQGHRFADSLLVGPIRAAVEDYLSRAICHAFNYISSKKSPKNAIAFWKSQRSIDPLLEIYFKLEINRLTDAKYKDYIINGDFSQTDPSKHTDNGLPPIAGWWYYDEYGTIRGAKGQYTWNDGVMGFGSSRYPGLRQFIMLPKGIYRLSFQYRSHNRKLPIPVNIHSLSGDITPAQLSTPKQLKDLSKRYRKFLQRSWPVPGDKWIKREAFFQVREPCYHAISIEPFSMGKDEWVWFDNIELEKID
jgi:hypothetical protein